MFFYAHQLTKVDYGHYQAFWVQLNIFNAVVGVGISMFSFTYPPEKIRLLLKRINPRFYAGYVSFLLICGLLFGWLQQENNLSFPWPVLFLAGFALCNISDAFLIIFRNFKELVVINLIYAIGFFGIHYYFLVSGFHFNVLLSWLLPLLLLKLIFSAWVLLTRNKKAQEFETPSESDFRGMFSLWKHLYLYDVLQISSLWIDKFIISLFMDSKDTATYINGTLSVPFLPILFAALTGSALIHLSENKTKPEQVKMANELGKVLSAVAFPLAIFLIFFRSEFIVFCFSDKYLASIPIFLFSILIIPFRAYGHTVLLQNMEQGKIINQGAVLDVIIALALMYPLYLLLGLPGVALSFVVSTFAQVLFYGFHTQRLIKISVWKLYPWRNWLFKALFFLIIALASYYGLPAQWSSTVRLLVGGGIMASFSMGILYREFKRREKPVIPSTEN